MVRGEAPREKNNVSGALSNRKHGLFYIRYFENGPLEPGRRKPSLGANESGPSGMEDFCHMNLICKLMLCLHSNVYQGKLH